MDYLYGKLNNEVKYREYKGSETTTATVTIDDSNTVSVDVKRVPNELTLTTINGDTYTYDGSEPASFDIRTQVTDKVEEGNNLPVTSDAVKGYVDSKAGALEYVGGEGNFTNIDGGVTVKGRLNVDDGIYSPTTSDDPNFVPNNKSVDDKITASEQKLIDERIGAFTRTEDKLFTDVTGGMTIKGKLNVDGGITSPTEPTSSTDVANKGYVDDSRMSDIDITSIDSARHDDTGIHIYADANMHTQAGAEYQGNAEMLIPIVGKDGVTIEDEPNNIIAVKADVEAIQKDIAGRFGNNSLWYTSTTGEPSGFGVTDAGDSGAIPVITDGLRLPETIPDENYVAVHKKYVDDGFVAKQIPAATRSAYTTDTNGDQSIMPIHGGSAEPFSIIARSSGGVARVGTPVGVSDATTKKYVDDADAKKLNLTGGTITGSLAIQGDLTVTGTTTTEKAQTLAVKDSVIITNADGIELGATLSGIAIRKDGENTYGVMYDPSGNSVKLGLGTLDADNKFTFNESGTEGRPIATRDDSGNLTDGDLVRWDGTTKSLVDSGKKVDDFVEKVTVTEGSNLAYVAKNDGTQGTLPVATGAYSNTLAQRTTNGRLLVGTAVEDSDAMPKKQVDDGFVAKIAPPDQFVYAYGYSGNTPVLLKATSSATANQLAYRGTGGVLSVGTPTEDSHATTKKYVDDADSKKVNLIDGLTAGAVVYATETANGTTIGIPYSANTPDSDSIVQRQQNGVIVVGTPTSDATDAAVNIEYANTNFVAKVSNKPNVAYTTNNNGDANTTHISFNPTAWDLVTFDGTACLRTSDPTGADERQCVNKRYADNTYLKQVTKGGGMWAYIVDGNDNQDVLGINDGASAWSLARRGADGRLQVGTPTGISDATTKAYVDNLNTITITAGA